MSIKIEFIDVTPRNSNPFLESIVSQLTQDVSKLIDLSRQALAASRGQQATIDALRAENEQLKSQSAGGVSQADADAADQQVQAAIAELQSGLDAGGRTTSEQPAPIDSAQGGQTDVPQPNLPTA